MCEIDGDFSHDPAMVPASSTRSPPAPTSRSARATSTAAAWRAGRRGGGRSRAPAARTRGRSCACPCGTSPSGLKCFRAEALEAIEFRTARARGYAFQVELTYRALRAGLRVVELPIMFRERREGESKMTGTVALEAAWRIPALRLQVARAAADPQE